jgi:hypothetical protein
MADVPVAGLDNTTTLTRTFPGPALPNTDPSEPIQVVATRTSVLGGDNLAIGSEERVTPPQ